MTKPVPAPIVRRARNLQPLEDAAHQRQVALRATIMAGIAKHCAARDAAIDARLGRGTGRAIGGTPSSADVLGTALRHEISTVFIDVLAGIFSGIQPGTIRERNVNAFCDHFREAVASKVRSKGAKP